MGLISGRGPSPDSKHSHRRHEVVRFFPPPRFSSLFIAWGLILLAAFRALYLSRCRSAETAGSCRISSIA
ncbi:hypothetical protein BO71DRAFT_427654 [Aspergillus ellipticus CBS 707.79]|uniref:Uncharacterized protein n=1 Tax=Aspergillus ellipticus CBS 707.79 TaxID=1448320 RepID=A0A319DHE4_9EURO|nr:hypothetical protein BO71DRAFT_427654 [Aspergillus ellipticus CBS 707.79]